MFIRRLGLEAAECRTTFACPQIWELEDGDFAIMGLDITEQAAQAYGVANRSPSERIVRIPRQLLVVVKSEIPDSLVDKA